MEVCPEHSTCHNLCIGHKCECDAGFKMRDEICVKICAENHCELEETCPENSDCIYDCDSGHNCVCHPGFNMENGKCVPECDQNQGSGCKFEGRDGPVFEIAVIWLRAGPTWAENLLGRADFQKTSLT